MKKKIDSSKWVWYGNVGHFICGHDCRFHMTTKVGKYLISTIGELWSDQSVRRIHASIYDQKWFNKNKSFKGDFFDVAYMKKFGYEDIGAGRKYETMVFKSGKVCGCGCGLPGINGSSLDFYPYNSAKNARIGHMKACEKWSQL